MSGDRESAAVNHRYERLTADEMDEQRRQNIAYQYLCHLEEANGKGNPCLFNEELPSPTDLEESLRNGVILAKLGHYFAPDLITLKKIYDIGQQRYKAAGLHFRHTDNINHWLSAMSHIGFPPMFYPETTDVYDKKNMPRVIYCIHALSLYLFKLGMAPQIQDLYGKVNFTDEEINAMTSELDKYGIQMPAFSKIGGILANELSVDEAAVHAAVIMINEAIERGVVEETLLTLLNPNAMLVNINKLLSPVYQELLYQAKAEKSDSARNRFPHHTFEGQDIYEEYLTQAEIQGNINKVNVHAALEYVDDTLEKKDAQALYLALKAQPLSLREVQRENADWYLEQLAVDREQKALELGYNEPLEKEELQAGVDVANQNAQRYISMIQAISRINLAVKNGAADQTVKELMNPEAQLPDVYPFAAELYQKELLLIQRQNSQGELVQEELFVAVEMLSAVALINQALEARDINGFWDNLFSPAAGLSDIEDDNMQRYFGELMKLKQKSQVKGDSFLSWNVLQKCVNEVNMSTQEEHDKILAIKLINEALEQKDPEKILTALLLPSAGLTDVELIVAKHYQDALMNLKRQKAEVTHDEDVVLWLDEIQQGINTANQDTENVKKMCLCIAAINQAVKEGKPSLTLRVLRSPDVSLYGIIPECAAAYQSELAYVMRAKVLEGNNQSPWVKHSLKDGGEYYFNLQSFEGTWERPHGFIQNSIHLSKSEIQDVISRVSAAHNRELLWQTSLEFIVRLQARMRGYLIRKEVLRRRNFLQKQLPAIIKMQAHWRGYKQRRAYNERLHYLKQCCNAAVKIQAWTRMWLARKKYLERQQYFRKHIDAIVKIQAFFRASKARDDYRMLVHARNPPLYVIQKFAHLLEQSDHDFREERELLKLREEVVKKIRSNQQLENDLNLMDIKIGLLVKNRITLQEVVSHCKKLTRKNKEQLSDLMSLDKQKGLKSLSKENREKLEAYQHLFYLLQTNPVYLAKLIFLMPQNKSTKFMESVIFSLYNYASDRREAYLLLQLFRAALQEEIKLKVDRLDEIIKGNPTVVRLVLSFYRNARGQNALREILEPVVKEVLQDKLLCIKTDPVDIYKTWINQMESQTGQKSGLPYDVTPEQALTHQEVQRRLDISVQNLRAVADKFLNRIIASVDKIPYGMRYISRVLKDSLVQKFPRATEEELCKIVGNLLYYRFMNPAVVAPDGFDIIDISAGVALHSDHRRNLGSIAKVLQHAAANKMFEGEHAHLRTMNEYLSDAHRKFRKFIWAACAVPDPEERLNVDKYTDMVTLAKPVIYISIGELINTHKLLLEHHDSISSDHSDPLHELLEDLGDVPTVHSLLGDEANQDSESSEDCAITQYGKVEISFILTNKFDRLETNSEEFDFRRLMLSTKQMLVDVIRFQPGNSLFDILRITASEDQESSHYYIMQTRIRQDARTPDKMKRNHSLLGDSKLSIEEKKRKIIRNLRKLETLGVVSPDNQYQDIINEIAKDIRNQRRYRQHRKMEIMRLRQTLNGLNSKTFFYEEQIDYYNQYIKTCLDNLTSSGRTDAKHLSESKGKNKKQASLHYTAARLYEKGVLLEIEDLPISQFKNVIFDIIPCEQAGTFQVKAKFLGVDMEKFQLHYQDLLQCQYEGVAVMKMFDKAKVNVNLLIFLLNKKFFKK
ncbi:ras GTPase-activating-like protein IQGAP3 [Protopterus annectens]|uniref:ras GTPase-activating-like protein IQGAP3 n=1 Tax=Protopterus annectens TaxID=7888 RepID=UPI001CF97730|nr:ras GTPase-activating-like protein IQGAP3 [Protopterus annectens]